MRKIIKWLYYFANRCSIRMKNRDTVLEHGAVIRKGSSLSSYTRVGENSDFYGELEHHSYIGSRCIINAHVGKYTSISSEVKTV